jgi:hypothetical protein
MHNFYNYQNSNHLKKSEQKKALDASVIRSPAFTEADIAVYASGHVRNPILLWAVVLFVTALVCSNCLMSPSFAQGENSSQISLPRLAPPVSDDTYKPAQAMEPKNIPDFASNQQNSQPGNAGNTKRSNRASSTALRGEAASTTIPTQTRMKLVLETRVDAQTSKPGDIFEGHVRDDLFVGSSLLLPKGSLIRGRISTVKKPRLISRAGRIGLRLDQIVTPTGEVIPLDAALEFKKGKTNDKGQLDPGTNFGSRVESNVRAVSGASSHGAAKGALVAANIATLGVPTIATAIGGSAIALFSSGDNVDLGPGQEIEIVLTDNLGLQIN